MSSMADVKAPEAALAIPRFEDGFVNMQELLGQLAESAVNEMMSAEANQLCEATGNGRDGCRERSLVTCVGTLTLGISRLRTGGFFPDDMIGRYQRADGAAVSETYATGTSTRRVQRVVGTFPDGRSALMLVTARPEYVAVSEWGSHRCLDMSLLHEWPHRTAGRPPVRKCARNLTVPSVSSSRQGNKQLKNLQIFSCSCLARGSGYYWEYYGRYRDRGMPYKAAIKAAARKRLKVIYAVMWNVWPCITWHQA